MPVGDNPFQNSASTAAAPAKVASLRPVLTVDYDINEQDLVDFSTFHCCDSRAGRRMTLFLQAVASGVVLWLGWLVWKHAEDPLTRWVLWTSGGVAAVISLVQLPTRRREYIATRTRRLNASRSQPPTHGSVSITPEKLIVSGPLVQHTIHWEALRKVESTPLFVCFRLSPVETVVVPKRAFPDSAAFGEFASLAVKWWEAAGEASPNAAVNRY